MDGWRRLLEISIGIGLVLVLLPLGDLLIQHQAVEILFPLALGPDVPFFLESVHYNSKQITSSLESLVNQSHSLNKPR